MYVIETPVTTIRSFVNHQHVKENMFNPDPQHEGFKKLLSLLSELVIDWQSQVMRLSPEEANVIWLDIENSVANIPDLDYKVRELTAVTTEQKTVFTAVKNLWNNWMQLIRDIEFIAHRGEVDEDSADYQNWLGAATRTTCCKH